MALVAVTNQNVASGKELQVQSLAVAGGTLYISTIRGGVGDMGGVAATFVATATAGSSSGAQSITTISTVGAGTLTAAAIGGGVITRSGSVAAYTDTTATGTQIGAVLTQFVQNSSMNVRIRNTVPFAQTITGGTGVTMAGEVIIPPNSEGTFLLIRTDANTGTPTFSMTGLAMSPLTIQPLTAAVSLSTVGAGTPLANGIVGGVTVRTGSTAAFTDTTDTAVNIIAALPNGNVGQSWFWEYVNNTSGPATIAGGSGVTMSGPVVVPVGATGQFLVTMSTASAVTMQGLGVASNMELPNAQNTAVTGGSATAAAGAHTGAKFVVASYSTQAAITVTTRTGTQLAADLPNVVVGQTYVLRINNQNTGLLTLTAASGVTISIDNASVAAGCFVDFLVTYTAANTFTWVGIGGGAIQPLPYAKFSTINVTTGTLAAGNASGAAFVNLTSTNATPGAQAMRTVAQVLADTPGLMVGMSYVLLITAVGAGTFTLATDGSAQFTMTGTMTVATNTTRTFIVTINSATTGTVQNVASGVYS